MGAAESSVAQREYENARSSFSAEEILRFDEFFSKLANDGPHHSPSKRHSRKFTLDSFEKVVSFELSKDVKLKIFDEFCSITKRLLAKDDVKYVNYDSFYVGISHLLKGSLSEKAYIFKILCTEKSSPEEILLPNVAKYLSELISTFVEIEKRSKNVSTWQFQSPTSEFDALSLVDYFSNDWQKFFQRHNLSENISQDYLEKWLGNNSMILLMMSTVFYTAFGYNVVEEDLDKLSLSSIPKCVVNSKNFQSFLNIPALFLLNQHLPSERRNEWRLLFSSGHHGESFSSLLKLTFNEGPCLIIVKEKNGQIFGGFSSVNLELSPNFVGDENCFLFTLRPTMRIYQATGFNKNYVYLNMHQETMPNGLGFGGRLSIGDTAVHFFGLWIDSEFGKGKSQSACSTYNSPQLSSTEHFEIHQMEVWGVGKKSDHKKEIKTKSILDSDPEVKAMLAMTGKGPVSEGLREEDDTADNPEHHQLPRN